MTVSDRDRIEAVEKERREWEEEARKAQEMHDRARAWEKDHNNDPIYGPEGPPA